MYRKTGQIVGDFIATPRWSFMGKLSKEQKRNWWQRISLFLSRCEKMMGVSQLIYCNETHLVLMVAIKTMERLCYYDDTWVSFLKSINPSAHIMAPILIWINNAHTKGHPKINKTHCRFVYTCIQPLVQAVQYKTYRGGGALSRILWVDGPSRCG